VKEPKKRACSIKSAKGKGRDFQKRVLERIIQTFELSDKYDVRSTVGREAGADIKYLNEESKDLVGLALECKNCRSLNIFKAIDQSRKYIEKGELHESVVFKFGGLGANETYIAITLDHYLDMRRIIKEHGLKIEKPRAWSRRNKKADALLATESSGVVSTIPGSDPLGETKGRSKLTSEREEG
jgi:hypothetical protein